MVLQFPCSIVASKHLTVITMYMYVQNVYFIYQLLFGAIYSGDLMVLD